MGVEPLMTTPRPNTQNPKPESRSQRSRRRHRQSQVEMHFEREDPAQGRTTGQNLNPKSWTVHPNRAQAKNSKTAHVHKAAASEASLASKASAPKPLHSTLNTQHYTLNTKRPTPNTAPSSLNPQPSMSRTWYCVHFVCVREWVRVCECVCVWERVWECVRVRSILNPDQNIFRWRSCGS